MWTILAIIIVVIIILYLSPLAFGGTPFEPTPKRSVERILEMSDIDEKDVVYDLGCGSGRILTEAAKKNDAKAVGIEVNPFLYLLAKLKIKISGLSEKAEVKFGDFYKFDLKNASLIVIFQSKDANKKLIEKLKDEFEGETKIATYYWPILGMTPEKTDSQNKVFLYNFSQESGKDTETP